MVLGTATAAIEVVTIGIVVNHLRQEVLVVVVSIKEHPWVIVVGIEEHP